MLKWLSATPWVSGFLGVISLFTLISCTNDPSFSHDSFTQYFVQDYNPEVLDLLWMIDDRSTLSRKPAMRAHLVDQATQFFKRLDQLTTSDYRLGFISGDLEFSVPGELRPRGSGVILTKRIGTLSERTNYFSSILGAIFNLSTSATNQGLESARQSLLNFFPTRAGVPLILVFISDSDDHSPGGTSAVDYFASTFLSIKNNRPDLLRIYSINYTVGGSRCATEYNADIDKAGFEDRFFRLARLTGGSTADLCTNFADSIDLNGLKLLQLPRKFRLEHIPDPSTIQVVAFDASGRTTSLPTYQYDGTTNEIVFSTAPNAGITIQVSFEFKS